MKQIRSFCIAVLFLCVLFAAPTGLKAEAATTKIYTAAQLAAVADNPSGNYILMNNISLSSYGNWTPIGSSAAPFTGTFNGNGYKITGLYVYRTVNYAGLFGYVKGGTIKNVTVSGKVYGTDYVAGIVALLDGGTIYNCWNKCSVSGANKVGGVCGCFSGVMYNCQNEGTINGSTRCAGGVTGDTYTYGYIYNCNNLGTVNGSNLTGGITGGDTKAVIYNCNNSGNVVSDSSKSGAIRGDEWSGAGTINNSYFRKTSLINTDYSLYGTDVATYATVSGALSTSIYVNGSYQSTALKALNGWISENSGIGYSFKSWKISNGQLRLCLTTKSSSSAVAVTSISTSSKLTTTAGESFTLSVKVSPSNATDTSLSYSSSSTSVATVSSSGKVTAKKAGVTTITIKAKDGSGVKTTCKILVYPKKNKITKLTSSGVSKGFTVKWSKASGATGYQIQYSKKSSFSSKETLEVTGSLTSCTIMGLTVGKTYYVRVRSYKTISGKRYYSSWSTKKKVKITK